MSRDRTIQIVAVVLVIAGLLGASALRPGIDLRRQALQLAPEATRRGGAVAPHVALMATALGSFRGLLVSVCWYRANQLKEEGKFHEANQLASFITDLQPRYQQVWSFHAWNMAYNISVATHTPEERWDWVNKGVTLLRDKGIHYNPNGPRLYRELSWIFFHKIGQDSDDMHWFYKRRLAREWMELLGTPSLGVPTEIAVANFRRIAEAPESLAATESATPGVGALVQRLAEQGHKPDADLLRQVGKLLMLNYSMDARFLSPDQLRIPPDVDGRLIDLLRDPGLTEPFDALIQYLRRKTLVETYHMDPAYMLELMEQYGPIDWRHPAAHSLYWSSLGVKLAQDLPNKKDVDLLNTHRSTIHSLQSLTFRGKIVFDPVTDTLDLTPDIRFIESYEKALESAPELLAAFGGGTTENFQAGHENFLLTAMLFCYMYGDVPKAQHYYEKVRTLYGTKDHNIASGRYMLPLADLVLKEWKETYDLSYTTRQFIDAMLRRAFLEGMAMNDPSVFAVSLDLAEKMHAEYQSKALANPAGVQDRMAFLKFDQVVESNYLSQLTDPSVPILLRARIWQVSPLPLRQRSYDHAREPMTAAALQVGLDPTRVIPEPEGMAEYRTANPPTPVTPQQGATPEQPAVERK